MLAASALFSVTMTAVLQALPMVQAVLLLGIYALLPMVVVLSRYSVSMMVIGAMAIFTVKFWCVLWYLALWVDQTSLSGMNLDVRINLILDVVILPEPPWPILLKNWKHYYPGILRNLFYKK